MKPSSQADPTAATTEVRWPRPGVVQVVLGGEHDLATADHLRQTLAELLERCSKLVVDLRETQFVDSSTIGVLVSASRRAKESGRGFNVVLATTPLVERVLEITGVLPALNRVHTLEQALGSV